MSDDTPVQAGTAEEAQERVSATKAIILSGWGLCALTSFMIIAGAVSMMVFTSSHDCPPVLREWAGTALGFLFGTCMTMVKDFVGKS